MISHDEQTIVAQCTPQGVGALALIRLSGTNAWAIADSIARLPSKKSISAQATHTIHYGSVVTDAGETIDHVLFLLMRSPHTFTGQDTVEITCHNNIFIMQNIIARSIQAGARLAHEGEFSKRAVLNNKMDLLQAEAIHELIHANSQQTLKQSLAQLDGSLSHHIARIEKNLIAALAYTNASFEFIDEENLVFDSTIHAIIQTINEDIQQLLQSFDQQKQLRNGIRVALIGSVNAGKSSLFNAIIGTNRAIVNERPGTTRDVIEAGFYDGGFYWTLADTAGIRQTTDIIEQEGIKRSLQEAHKADIILLVIDNSATMTPEQKTIYQNIYDEFHHKIIVIYHKIDLRADISPLFAQGLETSTLNASSITPLIAALHTHAQKLFQASSPYLLNERHYNLLLQLQQDLANLLPLLSGTIAYELIAYHLQEALAHCAEITGKSANNLAFDAVFKEFCIGK